MKISIITPHFNDFKGIQQTHECLKKQTSPLWEWIIVDDFSDKRIRDNIKKYFENLDCSNIQLVFNVTKTNASFCRNIGVDLATNNSLVFLDADDIISEDFVENRLIPVKDLIVFKNFHVKDKNGITKPFPTASSDYLEHFLQAKFIWQTTAVLWNKNFLIKIGKFNSDLKLLEDIELSMRALILSNNYKVIDNKVDFFYSVSPIDIKKRPTNKICEAVDNLINYMHANYQLNPHQKKLVMGYYFLTVRYLERAKRKEHIDLVHQNLKLFYDKKHIGFGKYAIGYILLKGYNFNFLSGKQFLRINRYVFKPNYTAG